MPRIVDEFHKPLGRKIICQPLHAPAAGRPHLGDLRDGQQAERREAAPEAKRAAAAAGNQPGPLTDRPYPKETLGHLEHQLGDRLALGADGAYDLDGEDKPFTELQVGSYIFMDVDYQRALLDGCNVPAFETGLFVATAVVSSNAPGYVTTDAGLKAFATDGSHPGSGDGRVGRQLVPVFRRRARQRPPLEGSGNRIWVCHPGQASPATSAFTRVCDALWPGSLGRNDS